MRVMEEKRKGDRQIDAFFEGKMEGETKERQSEGGGVEKETNRQMDRDAQI